MGQVRSEDPAGFRENEHMGSIHVLWCFVPHYLAVIGEVREGREREKGRRKGKSVLDLMTGDLATGGSL